jgi:hypothetical protein
MQPGFPQAGLQKAEGPLTHGGGPFALIPNSRSLDDHGPQRITSNGTAPSSRRARIARPRIRGRERIHYLNLRGAALRLGWTRPVCIRNKRSDADVGRFSLAAIIDDLTSEARTEPRTNLFVMASVIGDAGSAPVKLRNLSAHGALVEGAVLPEAGAMFRLCRGDLTIRGRVIWSAGGRAGLRFDGVANVSEWLPQGSTSGQQRVDELMLHIKGSGAPALAASKRRPPATSVTSGELRRLKEMLEELANDLADDDMVVERHASKLQVLDVVAQALGKLAETR